MNPKTCLPVSTDELVTLLGVKELELFAARRDTERRGAEQRDHYARNLNRAEQEIIRLRRKLADVYGDRDAESAKCCDEPSMCESKKSPHERG